MITINYNTQNDKEIKKNKTLILFPNNPLPRRFYIVFGIGLYYTLNIVLLVRVPVCRWTTSLPRRGTRKTRGAVNSSSSSTNKLGGVFPKTFFIYYFTRSRKQFSSDALHPL